MCFLNSMCTPCQGLVLCLYFHFTFVAESNRKVEPTGNPKIAVRQGDMAYALLPLTGSGTVCAPAAPPVGCHDCTKKEINKVQERLSYIDGVCEELASNHHARRGIAPASQQAA